ncbi:MAG: DegT/DnrJ/EryC1/StrS family aminotransferase, partial [Deltaproteobacteria bacterium]|nr:DegT/DnrJ/EryC1/StrS family aminotransferase [Deltaproteobacteria bacterium]
MPSKEKPPLEPLLEHMPFAPPAVGPEELSELEETLLSGWLTRGPKSEIFEAEMASYLGAVGALAVSSCTAALHLALAALEVRPGQGVITTPLTFPSTAHAIVYQRALPILVDVDPQTGCLDPALVREFLAEECRTGPGGQPVHKKTGTTVVAVMPVHYGGHPADLPAFWELAQERNLAVVEDAAHALGTRLNGHLIGHPKLRPAEAPSGFTAFSFYATKNLTTGEGGLLLASDPAAIERARALSAYGISDGRRIWGRYAKKGSWAYDVVELGYKYNFTDLQAALGLAQLKKLPGFLADRRLRAMAWRAALAPLGDLVELPEEKPGAESSWHLFPLRLRLERLSVGRDEIIERLKELNVGVSVMFTPLHYHTYYRHALGYPKGSFPLAEKFFAQE